MTEYNASNTRHIRAAEKESRRRDTERKGTIILLMSSPTGRAWIYDWLARCHVYHTPFTGIASNTDFNCGEQNIGLQLQSEIVAAAPEQYLQMLREASDKEQANDGRRDNSGSGSSRDSANDGRNDSGRSDDADGSADGSVESEYEPGPEN